MVGALVNMVVEEGFRVRFAPAGLRPPTGVLGLEQPTGLFDSLGVQIHVMLPAMKKAPW